MKDANKIFEKTETKINGCYELRSIVQHDKRGRFLKTFQKESFLSLGLETNFCEEYYSESYFNVLRGLHFQVPPKEHVKTVYCMYGAIMDVVVDLRKSSVTYGKYYTCRLDDKNGSMLYIPKGVAHGFLTLSDVAIVSYRTSSTYSPEHDKGILWNSVGIPWTCSRPIVSERDQKFPLFADFATPFD